MVSSAPKHNAGGKSYTQQHLSNGSIRKVIPTSDGGSASVTLGANGSRSKVVKDSSGKTVSSITVSGRVNAKTGKHDVTTFQRDAKTGDTTVIHANGRKTITSDRGLKVREERPDGSVIERTKVVNVDKSYTINRTTIINKVSRTETFNYGIHRVDGWRWGFYAWAPVYNPFFYDRFFIAPWGDPYLYRWTFAPWFGPYYGWWWNPYPHYRGPGYWIADWAIYDLIADNYEEQYDIDQQVLADQDAYLADLQQTEQDYADSDDSTLPNTPDPAVNEVPLDQATQDQLSAEVQDVITAYQAQSTITLDQVDTTKEIFTADAELTTVDENTGIACTITEGDLLKVSQMSPDSDNVAIMQVITTKGDSACPAGAQIRVSQQKLQEMLDAYSQEVVDGMTALDAANKAGQLSPSAVDSTAAVNTEAAVQPAATVPTQN